MHSKRYAFKKICIQKGMHSESVHSKKYAFKKVHECIFSQVDVLLQSFMGKGELFLHTIFRYYKYRSMTFKKVCIQKVCIQNVCIEIILHSKCMHSKCYVVNSLHWKKCIQNFFCGITCHGQVYVGNDDSFSRFWQKLYNHHQESKFQKFSP